MIDFVSAFFSWGKEEIKEPIDPREVEEKPKEDRKEYIFNKKVETEKGNIARKLILESREGEEDE